MKIRGNRRERSFAEIDVKRVIGEKRNIRGEYFERYCRRFRDTIDRGSRAALALKRLFSCVPARSALCARKVAALSLRIERSSRSAALRAAPCVLTLPYEMLNTIVPYIF